MAQGVVDKPIEKALRYELGPLGFEESTPKLKAVWQLSSLILRGDLSAYPEEIAQELVQLYDVFTSGLSVLASFQIDQGQAAVNQRQRAMQGITSVIAPLIEGLVRAVSFGLAAAPPPAIPSTAEVAEAIRRDTDELLIKLRAAEATASQTASAIQKAAATAGVGAEAKHFNDRANSHRTQGYFWLAATVVMGLVAGWYAWDLAFKANFVPAAPNDRTFYAQIAGRVILGSVLLWALVSAQRNYKAHRHNEILNRHRATALTTFETFVKGTSDSDTKNAVLVQTTQSIFAVQPTGYLSSEPDPAPQTTFVEILRRIGEKP